MNELNGILENTITVRRTSGKNITFRIDKVLHMYVIDEEYIKGYVDIQDIRKNIFGMKKTVHTKKPIYKKIFTLMIKYKRGDSFRIHMTWEELQWNTQFGNLDFLSGPLTNEELITAGIRTEIDPMDLIT